MESFPLRYININQYRWIIYTWAIFRSYLKISQGTRNQPKNGNEIIHVKARILKKKPGPWWKNQKGLPPKSGYQNGWNDAPPIQTWGFEPTPGFTLSTDVLHDIVPVTAPCWNRAGGFFKPFLVIISTKSSNQKKLFSSSFGCWILAQLVISGFFWMLRSQDIHVVEILHGFTQKWSAFMVWLDGFKRI